MTPDTMIPKMNDQGTLIYVTMGGYLLSLMAGIYLSTAQMLASKMMKTCEIFTKIIFFCTFLLSFSALIYRWIHVEHLPMQNMFEVFLFLGFCIWPIHILSNKILGTWNPSFIAIDAAIGLIVLFPAGFVFNDQPQHLHPSLQFWLFGPHVAAYMLSYIFMAKAAVFAFVGLVWPADEEKMQVQMSEYSYLLVAAGFPLLTLGLLLGSIWGKYAWGDWWGWDPKELWSLVCWLVYAAYFHVRFAWPKSRRLQDVLVVLGLIAIIITLLWVNLSKLFNGMHNYAS